MVERDEIDLLYQYDDNWIGGTYYIINLIKSLNCLNDADKPKLTVYHNSESSLEPIRKIEYPYIEFNYFDSSFNIFERVLNKLSFFFLGSLFIRKKINFKVVKNLYPMSPIVSTTNVKNFYYWIPDFQERYLPHLFSKKQLKERMDFQKKLVKKKYPIIFSSNNALEDFNKFYPENKNTKKVLSFVSIIDENYSKLNISNLKEKYNIKGDFFISPNQFWVHKNQIIVLKAAIVLKEKGVDFRIVFTGKEFDSRNPNYTLDLKKLVKEHKLEKNILFLGFIDRDEQLQLMKNSIAIIQPSLFEGWSTVVEDTKALNHVILLSDLPLHREQIQENCVFFDPYNADELAVKLENTLKNSIKTGFFNNRQNQLDFAKKVISIFK